MYLTKYSGWLLVLALLSGCGWLRDGDGLILNPKDDYLDAKQAPPLQIPPDLGSLEDTDPFPIPQTPAAANPSFYPDKPPLPDAIYANDNRDEVRIQRLGERRWLVIPEPPTTAWPKLKQFLAENAIPVDYEAPQSGRLNTDWLQIQDEAYRDVIRSLLKDAKQGAGFNRGKDRFLIRVEQGLRPFTTEVHARHENDSLTLPVDDQLETLDTLYSDNQTAESDFLNEIGAYIAARVSEQTVSKVALQIGSSKKTELARSVSGYPVLRLFLDYERAWATLGQALENAEIGINHLDRETGVFDIAVPEERFVGESNKGFLCRLTFSCDNNEALNLQLQMQALQDRVFNVSVLDAQTGEPIEADLAQQVLVMLREYAS